MDLAAIAFGDSLTAKRGQVVNQQVHRAAPRLLRAVMQNTLSVPHERHYRHILGYKEGPRWKKRNDYSQS